MDNSDLEWQPKKDPKSQDWLQEEHARLTKKEAKASWTRKQPLSKHQSAHKSESPRQTKKIEIHTVLEQCRTECDRMKSMHRGVARETGVSTHTNEQRTVEEKSQEIREGSIYEEHVLAEKSQLVNDLK